MKYGQRLEHLLQQTKKSRTEFGAAIGCVPTNLSQLFADSHGTDRKLTIDKHFKAAKFLGVDPEELYTGIPVKPKADDSKFSFDARTIAKFFDKIPAEKEVEKMLVYQDVMKILLEALQRLSPQVHEQELGQSTQ